MVSTVLIVQFLSELFSWTPEVYSTFVLVLGGFVGLLVVRQVCSPMNQYHKIIMYICIGIYLFALLFLPGFYDIHHLFMWRSILLLPLGLLVAMLIYWYSRLTNRFVKWFFRER